MGYFGATRHPWICLLFLLPLIAAYEGGVMWLSGTEAQVIRNGADTWIRWGLESFGVTEFLAAPGFIVGWLLIWTMWRWDTRPQYPIGTVLGMALECILLGLLLRAISIHFPELLRQTGIRVETLNVGPNVSQQQVAQVLTYVGAGIYEEVLFRLILFSGLALVLRIAFVPALFALPMAAVISSLLFAGAHHVGPFKEEFDRLLFLFRTAAGLFFTLIYWLRGFGVAVGTHTAYDVIVGIDWK